MRYLRPSSTILVKGPALVVGLFMLFSVLWILATDLMVDRYLPKNLAWHTAKGMLYVCVSAALLYVTSRRVLQQSQKVEQTLSKIFMQSEMGVCLVALDGRFLDCNSRFARMLGYEADELIGTNLQRLVDPESLPQFGRDWRKELESDQPTGFVRQRKYIRKNGSAIWVKIAASRINPGPKLDPFMVGLVQDVTHEVEASEALSKRENELRAMLSVVQKSEARFKKLVESTSTGVLIGNEAGLITDANEVLLRLLGYTREELERGELRWTTITPPEYREVDLLAQEELRQSSRFSPYEKEYIAKDGERIPVLLSGASTREQALEAVVTVTDLRDARGTEAQLSRLVLAVENAYESIMITDLAGNIVYVNPAFEELSGYSRAEVHGKNAQLLRSKESEKDYQEMWLSLSSGERWKGRLWTRRKDGSENLEDATVTPVRDSGGRIINYLAVKRDITREHALEHRLMQSQKMQAIGQLAGGVAHDVNNVLQAVYSSAELGLRKVDETAYAKRKFEDILAASQRGAGIVAQLLAFTRKHVAAPCVLNMNDIVTETGTMLRRLLPENVELVMELGSELKPVMADRTHLSQVLMNLAVNARDAMPDGGILRIVTGNAGKGVVRLSVEDNGVGIEESVRTKMFEPFFTTKEPGKGTGLGLSTVSEILRYYNARISVKSEPGKGSQFEVDLPANEM